MRDIGQQVKWRSTAITWRHSAPLWCKRISHPTLNCYVLILYLKPSFLILIKSYSPALPCCFFPLGSGDSFPCGTCNPSDESDWTHPAWHGGNVTGMSSETHKNSKDRSFTPPNQNIDIPLFAVANLNTGEQADINVLIKTSLFFPLQHFQKVIPHQFDSGPDKVIQAAYQVKYNAKKMKK